MTNRPYNFFISVSSNETSTYISSVQQEIISYNCSNLIKKHPVFKDANPLYLLELLDKLEFECYQPGELIIGIGTVGDCMYFIEKGDVEVASPGYTQILSDGSFFGGNGFQPHSFVFQFLPSVYVFHKLSTLELNLSAALLHFDVGLRISRQIG